MEACFFDGEVAEILLPALFDDYPELATPACVVRVEELAVDQGGAQGAQAEGDVAEADLQVVEVVDLGELRGDDGGDVVESREEEAVVEEDQRVFFVPENVQRRQWVGKAHLGPGREGTVRLNAGQIF